MWCSQQTCNMDPKHWPISVAHLHLFIVGASCTLAILISHSHQNYRSTLIFVDLIDSHSFIMQTMFWLGTQCLENIWKVHIHKYWHHQLNCRKGIMCTRRLIFFFLNCNPDILFIPFILTTSISGYLTILKITQTEF